MSDPALKGIVLDSCMAARAADAQCQAFTYNTSARGLLLKSAATNPSAYGGAISGMRRRAEVLRRPRRRSPLSPPNGCYRRLK